MPALPNQVTSMRRAPRAASTSVVPPTRVSRTSTTTANHTGTEPSTRMPPAAHEEQQAVGHRVEHLAQRPTPGAGGGRGSRRPSRWRPEPPAARRRPPGSRGRTAATGTAGRHARRASVMTFGSVKTPASPDGCATAAGPVVAPAAVAAGGGWAASSIRWCRVGPPPPSSTVHGDGHAVHQDHRGRDPRALRVARRPGRGVPHRRPHRPGPHAGGADRRGRPLGRPAPRPGRAPHAGGPHRGAGAGGGVLAHPRRA